MGKFNRFRPLQKLPGVRQIADVTTYKKAPDELTGEGLCAAMSMRWLQSGEPPTMASLNYANRLQTAYINKMEETRYDTLRTISWLANRCGLTLQGQLPKEANVSKPTSAARRWWRTMFGVGAELESKRFSSVIAGALSAYANEQLNTAIEWKPGAADAQHLFPCFVGVHMHCPSITLLGETLTPSERKVRFDLEDGTEHAVVFNDERLIIDDELMAIFGGPHAFALQRGTGGSYVYFDPNVGVYATAGLGALIDTVHECYRKVNEPNREVWAEQGLVAADVDLQLVRIYPLQPQS